MDEPDRTGFPEVLQAEKDEIARLRKARGAGSPDHYVGLALSGGGIRSATFNLGVLQALAKLRLLGCIDYLSTVSGGGYIGSWLAAWLKREPFEQVEAWLNPEWSAHPQQGLGGLERPAPPLEFLRDYSNYLTPRLGFLGADTWAAVATFFRNLLLNLAVFTSLFVAALLVPYLLAFGLKAFRQNAVPATSNILGPVSFAVLGLGLLLALLAAGYLLKNLRQIWDVGSAGPATQGEILARVAVPLLAATVVLSIWLSAHPPLWNDCALRKVQLVLAALIAVELAGWFLLALLKPTPWPTMGRLILYGGLAGHLLISLTANWWVLGKVFQGWNNGAGMNFKLFALGVPLSLLITLLAAALQVGLAGLLFRNQLREWTARLGGWVLILALLWLGVFGIALYSPLVAMWAGAWVSGAVTAAWIVHTISGVLAAYNSKSGKAGSSGWLDILARTAPPVFVVGLFVLLSFGIYKLLGPSISPKTIPSAAQWNAAWVFRTSQGSASVTPRGETREPYIELARRYWESMDQKSQAGTRPWIFPAVFSIALLIGLLLSWCVDVNDFSMHLFYRNRLVRCYLGASRPPDETPEGDPLYPFRRQPNRFTGFDPDDDVLLATLTSRDCLRPYSGPYPILNAALNLTHGRRLAWQERKAESFTFTPLYCGGTQDDSEVYRPTWQYTYPDGGPFLGTALAISGAAVSPFIGFHSSPAAGFLLTVFNARLNQWLRNPSQAKWNVFGPRWGLPYIVAELLGLMNTSRACVCLSDGGHFENLALYELVRRQVSLIIACDASTDPELEFEDLGKAIRKCRADFGAEIEINLDAVRRNPSSPFGTANFAVGSIRYADGGPGVLVYLKASLTGKEPADVLEYHSHHPEFPQQTIADQWFDESQFESYRRLGQYIAELAFASVKAGEDGPCQALLSRYGFSAPRSRHPHHHCAD